MVRMNHIEYKKHDINILNIKGMFSYAIYSFIFTILQLDYTSKNILLLIKIFKIDDKRKKKKMRPQKKIKRGKK
jgi:hypothetical protein